MNNTLSNNSSDVKALYDYRHVLTESETVRGRFKCPVCDRNNLSVIEKGFQCFSGGCDTKSIHKAVMELAGEWNNKGFTRILPSPKQEKKATRVVSLVSIPAGLTIEIATLPSIPTDIPQEKTVNPEAAQAKLKLNSTPQWVTAIEHEYSDKHKVTRYDYEDPNSEKKRSKSFRQSHHDGFDWKLSKGSDHWPPYRFNEALLHSKGKVGLVLEGEKCVDVARSVAIAAFTFQGSNWNEKDIEQDIKTAQEAGVAVKVFVIDNDEEGRKKGEKVAKACNQLDFPYAIIKSESVTGNSGDKYDIADWINEMIKKGLTAEEVGKIVCDRLLEAVQEQARIAQNDTNDFDVLEIPLIHDDLYLVKDQSVEVVVKNALFGDDWMVQNDCFYRHSGAGHWQKVDDKIVERDITVALQKCYSIKGKGENLRPCFIFATNSKAESCFKFIRKTLTRNDVANNHLRCFKNCTVDFRTGESYPHRKDDYLISMIPYDYEKGAACPPNFDKYLKESFTGDLIPLVRAVISMIIDPTAPYGYFPHLIGASGSGKGVLARLLGSFFDAGSVQSINSFEDLNDKDKRHQTLSGTKYCYFPDVVGYVSGLDGFYELVDNGMLSGRPLFSSTSYTKRWDCRFAVASVNLLKIENTGTGWQRRAIPIPFNGAPKIADPDLASKLEPEIPAIISWALSMEREERDRYLKDPSMKPSSVKKLQVKQSISGDSVKAFLDSCVELGSESDFEALHSLHSYYKAFCKELGFKENSYNTFKDIVAATLPHRYIESHPERIGNQVVRVKTQIKGVKLNTSFITEAYGDRIFNRNNCIEGNLEILMKMPETIAVQGCNGHQEQSNDVTGCNGFDEMPETRAVTGCNGCNGQNLNQDKNNFSERTQLDEEIEKKESITVLEKVVTPVTSRNHKGSSDFNEVVTPVTPVTSVTLSHSKDSSPCVPLYDDLLQSIKTNRATLGLTKEECQDISREKYGKSTIKALNDEEFLDFDQHLKDLVAKSS